MPQQHAHAALPRPTLDEAARQDFVMALRGYLAGTLTPGNEAIYHAQAAPAFAAETGRAPQDRHEVRAVMLANPYYQFWSATQRASQQMMWDSVIDTLERSAGNAEADIDRLVAEAPAGGSLTLNPDLPLPDYLTLADIHLMPGGYHSQQSAGDASQGGLYDRGLYLYIGGNCGPENDGLAHMLRALVQQHYPDIAPQRILDLGCTIGNCTLPWKRAFPDAEVYGIDLAAPVLRYGHARAEALGVPVHFVQGNAESTDFEAASFDLIVSCLFLHETSPRALPRILAECRRLLRPGGVMAHLDVPQTAGLSPLQAFLTSWEEENNNENFAYLFREMDLDALSRAAGFAAERVRNLRVPMADGSRAKNYDAGEGLHWTLLMAQA